MKTLKAPQWNAKLTPEKIEQVEAKYGVLAETFQALARLIEQADGLFKDSLPALQDDTITEIIAGGPLTARDDTPWANMDYVMFQSPKACGLVMRIIYSTLNLKPKESVVGPIEEFYQNLKIALRFYKKTQTSFQECSKSGDDTRGPVDIPEVKKKWAYMGQERTDGPTTSELIDQLLQWHSQFSCKKNDPKTLTGDELKVLDALNESFPEICSLEQLETPTKITRKTISKHVIRLKSYSLIEIPKGRSVGLVITSQGREYLNDYF